MNKRMIKDTWEKNENATANKKEITVLKEHFPACFKKDGSFDIERFKEYLSEDINVVNEGYELKFLGKNYARLLVTLETETVIVPNEEHNQKEENKDSENIYITGDNLDGLKHLLKSYSGKVKCIYIDPPYNTGSDGFVYNDNFNFTIEELTEKLSIGEEQAQRILDLTKRGSASHSAWLMFMYPRLQLARDLLSDDGVIFISIDDNEQANLKLLCDDVLGEDKFLGSLVWTNKEGGGSSDSKNFRIKHEYILSYGKDLSQLDIFGVEVSNVDRYTMEDQYVNTRGKYYLQKLGMGSIQYSESLDYPIKAPDGNVIMPKDNNNGQQACWRWSKEKFQWGIENDYIVFIERNKQWTVYTKQYLNADNEGNIIKRTQRPLGVIDKYSSTQAAKALEKLNLKGVFDYTKPVKLIEYLINRITSEEDIVLDFFSGSATTAHSTLSLNEQNNLKRKFIMIQIPELVKKNSTAEKQNFETIDEIGRERIIRVANKIKEENPNTSIDLGFKHFTLIEPTSETMSRAT
jgi:adenine specific DNA methylase Mod